MVGLIFPTVPRPALPVGWYREKPVELVADDGRKYDLYVSMEATPLIVSRETGKAWGITREQLIQIARDAGIDGEIG